MQTRSSTWFPVAGLALLWLAGCSGGGSDPAGVKGTSGDFLVLRTTPPNNGRLFLNESLAIDFSNPVDLDSADLNTVSFQAFDLSGNPVEEQPAGEFSVVDDRSSERKGTRLLFSPRFPTNDRFDNGGFRPGRRYIVQLVGGNRRNGTVLRDVNGKALQKPLSFEFTTPDGSTPAQLFSDTRPGGPRRTGFEVTPANAQGVALNKFSARRVEVRLLFDQPLNPASTNVPVAVEADPLLRSEEDKGRIFLEYDDPQTGTTWIPATVDIEVNTREGSEVVLRPIGVLPNNATVRVIVRNTVEDMSGQSNAADAGYVEVFGTFTTRSEFQPQYDAVVEQFEGGSAIDFTAAFLEPSAVLRDGGVQASFQFEGGETRLTYRPTSRQIILNTDFTQIVPENSPPINVQGGVFSFARVEIPEGVEVSGVGTNPMTWLVTGDFVVNGVLHVNGGDGARVDTLNSANFPTPGGVGVAGGGNGGRGSPNATNRSPTGEPGFGPGQKPGAGGQGGRLACSGGCTRGSAGGGGSLGMQGDPYYPPTGQRWDQVGGFGGEGCQSGGLAGGAPGPLPFTDSRVDNNFWGSGVNVFEGIRIQGELLAPVAGSGGGGGGDKATSCNPDPVGFINDNKGGGGGGGAGVLIVKCLGKITIGPRGRISADGGNGGGGEQAGANTQGAGGGGGSGGMVVLMAGQGIDIWVHGNENTNPPRSTYGELDYSFAISADGGIGTQGRFGPQEIIKKYPPGNTSWGNNPTGGFGGMGIIQLMVPPGEDQDDTGNRLDDNIRFLYRDVAGAILEVSPERKKALLAWRGWPDANGVFRDDVGDVIDIGSKEGDIRPSPIMLPSPFGPVSRARSRWIDLGFAARERVDKAPGPDVSRVVVAAAGQEPRPDFEFAGTNDTTKEMGYALYTSTGNQFFPPVQFGGLTDLSIAGVQTAAQHEGVPAYNVELGPEVDLGIRDRYVGYRLQILNSNGSPLRDFRILAHGQRTLTVEPNGAFPTEAAKARVLAKFFEVVTEGQPGLGPVYDLGTGQVPVANVRIGFAFHTNPEEGRGPNRWPNATSAEDALFEFDLSNPDFHTWLETHRPTYVQWDVLFNTRFHPETAGNLSGEPLRADMPMPRLDYLVLPFRF